MPEPIAFDPTPYLHPPRIDIGSGIALVIALLTALAKAPFGKDGAPATIKKAAKRMRKACVDLQAGWAERDKAAAKPSPTLTPKQADVAVDTAWAALIDRLSAYGDLPGDRYPNAARASTLKASLFPAGASFVAFKYRLEWSHGDKLLRRIDDEKLAADLDALCGPDFLAEVRRCHADYGAALHITEAEPTRVDATALLPLLQGLGSAVASYQLKLIAHVELDDPATAKAVQAALLPCDKLRAEQARAGGQAPAPAEDPTPVTPVPDAPA